MFIYKNEQFYTLIQILIIAKIIFFKDKNKGPYTKSKIFTFADDQNSWRRKNLWPIKPYFRFESGLALNISCNCPLLTCVLYIFQDIPSSVASGPTGMGMPHHQHHPGGPVGGPPPLNMPHSSTSGPLPPLMNGGGPPHHHQPTPLPPLNGMLGIPPGPSGGPGGPVPPPNNSGPLPPMNGPAGNLAPLPPMSSTGGLPSMVSWSTWQRFLISTLEVNTIVNPYSLSCFSYVNNSLLWSIVWSKKWYSPH